MALAPTIFIRLQGGLGNQLFQWALGQSLALNATVVYDNRGLEHDATRRFMLPDMGIPDIKTGHSAAYPVLNEKSLRYEAGILRIRESRTLVGYWQCERYFDLVKDKIRAAVFSSDNFYVSGRTLDVEGIILERRQHSCFVHVRRSDMAKNPQALAFHGCQSADYYRKAMDLLRAKNRYMWFYVFSDDMAWAKENLAGDRVMFIDHNAMSGTCDENGKITVNKIGREVEDLYLMSCCHNAIIPNSTFGWWGAWLGEKPGRGDRTVVAPVNWFAPGNTQVDATDIVPERWVRLE